MSPGPDPANRRVRLWRWVAVALAALAVVFLTVAGQSSGRLLQARSTAAPEQTTTTPHGSEAATPKVREPGPSTPVVVRSPPVHLRIPAIGLEARVTRLGLNPDHTVEVPANPMNTGWYKLGPAPGQPGSAVILGHVDSRTGTAVFARLRDLQPGDVLHVEAANGSTSSFRVKRLVTYPNAKFPAADVYATTGKGRLLNLITCGGAYDPDSGYQANLVVYTRLVSGS